MANDNKKAGAQSAPAGMNMGVAIIGFILCFIGGAATTGGVGKVIGAVIGAFIMGVMNNGMSIMGIGIDWQQVIKGAEGNKGE